MVLYVEHETDTAHRLSCHKGKCKNVHGHRYKFVLGFQVEGTIEDGDKFKDFYDIKKIVREQLDENFDHQIILKQCSANVKLIDALMSAGCRVRIISDEPTVEIMCKEITQFQPFIDLGLVSVTVYETPTNYCMGHVINRGGK